jgi:citrate synthase
MRTIGIPTSMFTPLFAVARTVGWIAHWIEMLSDPEAKLARPRQLYVGAAERNFVEVDARMERRATVG